MIEFSCSHCGAHFKVSVDKGGKHAKCPKCGVDIRIPIRSSETERSSLSSDTASSTSISDASVVEENVAAILGTVDTPPPNSGLQEVGREVPANWPLQEQGIPDNDSSQEETDTPNVELQRLSQQVGQPFGSRSKLPDGSSSVTSGDSETGSKKHSKAGSKKHSKAGSKKHSKSTSHASDSNEVIHFVIPPGLWTSIAGHLMLLLSIFLVFDAITRFVYVENDDGEYVESLGLMNSKICELIAAEGLFLASVIVIHLNRIYRAILMKGQVKKPKNRSRLSVNSFTRGEFFFAAGSLLAAICVFLPWASFDVIDSITISGFGYGWRGWGTLLGGLLCAASSVLKPLLAQKLTGEQMKKYTKATPIAGLVVFGVVLISFFDNLGVDNMNVGIGLLLALLGMLGAVASVVVSNYLGDKPFAAFFAAPMFGKAD